MKKIIFYISFMSVFFLTGCGTQTLKCQMVNDANEELKITQDVILDFKKESLIKVNMRTIVDLSDNYANYADDLEKNLKSQYKNYDNKKGIDIKTTKDKKKVTLIFTADINKMSKKTKEKFDLVGTSETLSEVKSDLEQQGYTCKKV